MKIELEFKDLKEFSNFISGLNNAIIAYDDVKGAIDFACEVSPKWDNVPVEKMRERLKLLRDKYFELLDIEKEIEYRKSEIINE